MEESTARRVVEVYRWLFLGDVFLIVVGVAILLFWVWQVPHAGTEVYDLVFLAAFSLFGVLSALLSLLAFLSMPRRTVASRRTGALASILGAGASSWILVQSALTIFLAPIALLVFIYGAYLFSFDRSVATMFGVKT